MIDWTKPIETHAGVAARVLATGLAVKGGNTIVVALYDGDDTWKVYSSTRDGQVCGYLGEPTMLRLRNAPVKREGWVNVYPHPHTHERNRRSVLWLSKEDADAEADANRVACVRIEWEEAP